MADLCHFCRSFNNSALTAPARDDCNTAADLATAAANSWYDGPSLQELYANSDVCSLCRALRDIIPHTATSATSRNRVTLRFVDETGGFSDATNLYHLRSGEVRGGVYGIAVRLRSADVPDSGIHLEDGLRVFAPQDAPETIQRLVPRAETALAVSEQTFSQAKSWLSQCHAEHWRCRHTLANNKIDEATAPAALPTRVISVSCEESPKLIVTNGETGSFAALSYRWGTSKTLITTKGNLNDMQDRLSPEQLPATIRDAIESTKQLGIAYLWVDSLCIVQDDDNDWEREAALMPLIYQNAIVTITVLGDRDSDSGFFERRPVQPIVTIPWLENDGGGSFKQTGHIYATSVLPLKVSTVMRPRGHRKETETALAQELRSSPWNNRAWTFQERMLSRRILYFGDYQIYWECQTGSKSEDGFDETVGGLPDKRIWQERVSAQDGLSYVTDLWKAGFMDHNDTPFERRVAPIGQRLTKATSRLASTSLVRSARAQFQKTTRLEIAPGMALDLDEIIRDYTSRQLTVSNDKLVAFDGLASVIAQRTNQEYRAGVWTNQLAKSLFWHPHDPTKSVTLHNRAPSWSWASRDGQIRGWNNAVNSLGGDSFGLRYGALEGDLTKTAFVDGNSTMNEARGVNPVSLRTDAFCAAASCSSGPLAWTQHIMYSLAAIIQLWPRGYDTWDPPNSHLLFITNHANSQPRDTEAAGKVTLCQECNISCNATDEATAIRHMEECRSGNHGTSVDDTGRHTKLTGVALFDSPHSPPSKFETLVLWHEGVTTTFWQANKPSNSFLRSSIWRMSEIPPMRPLYSSQKYILGLDVSDEPMDIGPQEAMRHFTRRMRRYFLLLVEPTGAPSIYRRVGIGLAYWLPGLERFGGVPLHKMGPRKTVTLL